MSDIDDPTAAAAAATAGARTAVDGTPVPVDVSGDRQTRDTLAILVAGPVIWFAHFMFVYLVAEAGCTGSGEGLDVFDPPVPRVTTLVATAVAGVACLALAWWAFRRWQISRSQPPTDAAREPSPGLPDADRGGTLAVASLLLSLLFFVSILFVGIPAIWLAC